jgi:hypothetical protein
VTNTGLLAIGKLRAYFYVHHLELPPFATVEKTVTGDPQLVDDLDRGETKTIMFRWSFPSGVWPESADIAVITEYSAPWMPFWRFHRIFRFKGASGETFQWQPQPSAEIAEDANKAIAKFGAVFK